MNLDLLSAENYQEVHYEQKPPDQRESGIVQVYGGFLATGAHETKAPSPPANVKTRRSSRKQTSKGAAADETVTRQRGRPRLDNRDQTAAERRRTQIRLAQRAYRQRKETTISGLSRRVTSLEKAIEDMHSYFLDFNDKAIAGGLQNGAPALAEHLKVTAERICELAKISKQDSDNEDEESIPNLSTRQASFGGDRTSSSPRTAAVVGSRSAPMMGYQTILEQEPDDYTGETAHKNLTPPAQLDQFPLSDRTATEAIQQYQNNISGSRAAMEQVVEPMQQHQMRVPATTIDPQSFQPADARTSLENSSLSFAKSSLDLMSLPMPTSHSYHETSFARRLMRSTVEANIRLMTDPNSSPEDLSRLCRFTWCFAKSSDMMEHMLKIGSKTTRDGLELWDVPRLHLGGAGLHYPRAKIDGDSPPPTWWANEAPMGPQRLPHAQTPVPDTMAISDIIQKVQVEGDWFDSSDVEQYLRGKGLYLDGQSSIVEITEPEDSVPELQEAQVPSISTPGASSPKDSTRGPRSPEFTDSSWFTDPFVPSTDYDWTGGMAVPEVLDINMDISFDTTVDSNAKVQDHSFDFSTYSGPVPTLNTKIKRFLDVNKFLETIAQKSMCVGRTAGFRKSAIDFALDSATMVHPLGVDRSGNGITNEKARLWAL